VIALLPALSLAAFLTAAFGDTNEPVKHRFLFNFMLDAPILAGAAGVFNLIRGEAQKREQKPEREKSTNSVAFSFRDRMNALKTLAFAKRSLSANAQSSERI